mgnify:CR=1 FL=1
MGAEQTAKGLRQSPRHPSAKCMTKILSYGVPFEKFSWCFRSEDFCINISADLHGCPMSLRLLMLLVFLYSSDLHLKLTNPTCFIALRASAVSHTTGPSTSRLRRARGNPSSRKLKFPRFSRQRNSLKQLTSSRSVLMHQAWPKRGRLRGTIGLRNYEIVPLRVWPGIADTQKQASQF